MNKDVIIKELEGRKEHYQREVADRIEKQRKAQEAFQQAGKALDEAGERVIASQNSLRAVDNALSSFTNMLIWA